MFTKYTDAFKDETDFRLNLNPDKLCTYGIKPLDDANVAIAPNELVVIAASSGYGKTEAALAISRHNAMRGKRVAHYHLEGGAVEAIQRMKWRDISELYFSTYYKEHIELDYRNWAMNKDQSPLMLKMESEVYTNLKDKLQNNLYFYNRPEGLTCEDFTKSLLDFHNLELAFENPFEVKGGYNLDLIVLDHIHYFRYPDEEQEIRAITNIMLAVRDVVDKYHIPVVLVAHFRKLPRGHGVPDKDDIYGSSNIHKMANTCIIIHPDHEKDKSSEGLYPTYLRIAKSRIGIRPCDCIQVDFDIHTRSYKENYDMIKVFPNGSVAGEVMTEMEKPRWARTLGLHTNN